MIFKDEMMLGIVKNKLLAEDDVDLSIQNMLSKAIEYTSKILEFKKPDPENMLEVEESEELATDARLFQAYNAGVENVYSLGSVLSEAINPYENVIKFEYKAKEIIIAFTEDAYCSENYNEECYEVTLFMNVTSKKRLHFNIQSDISYEKSLDKYDFENDERFSEYLSDRVVEWKNKETFNLEKYILTDLDKDFLKEIYFNYKNPFIVSLKDGILCINSQFRIMENQERQFEEICYFIQEMILIIDRFLNI